MQVAVKNNQRRKAFKGAEGFQCPGCGGAVIPKCGTRYIHHWAHANNEDCDTWSETEGEWHLAWKNHFPEGWLEIVMGENREHRADIRRPDGLVIELQNSPISLPDAKERCEFYGDIIWIFNAFPYIKRCYLLCRYGQHAPGLDGQGLRGESIDDGKPCSEPKLTNPAEVWEINSIYHSNPDKASLPISVPMGEAPEEGRGVTWEMREIQKRIRQCKERMEHFSERKSEKKVTEWRDKLTVAQQKLQGPDPTVFFMTKPVPANSEEFCQINVAGVDLEGVPLRLKWSRRRAAFSELSCPFLWDFNKDFILYFPPVKGFRQFDPYLNCVLIKKAPVIQALNAFQ